MAADSMQTLAVEYGYAYAFFQADSELTKLLRDAWNGKWTPQKFQAKFMTTGWFRAREASMRQWADLKARDPAEAQNKISESKAWLEDQFTQLGINLDDATITSLATDRLAQSWSDSQTQNILASYINMGHPGGSVSQIQARVNSLAFNQGVDVSPGQMQDWVQGIVSQKYTEANLEGYLKDMAKSKYSGMTGFLDQGMTVRQVAAPYIQEFSRLMEVNPDTVDLNDPLMSTALQGRMDPQTNKPTMMTVAQTQKAIKQDQRWLYTGNAKRDMTDLGIGVLKDMGLAS